MGDEIDLCAPWQAPKNYIRYLEGLGIVKVLVCECYQAQKITVFAGV